MTSANRILFSFWFSPSFWHILSYISMVYQPCIIYCYSFSIFISFKLIYLIFFYIYLFQLFHYFILTNTPPDCFASFLSSFSLVPLFLTNHGTSMVIRFILSNWLPLLPIYLIIQSVWISTYYPVCLDICLVFCLSTHHSLISACYPVWPFCLNVYPACHPVYLDICMVHWLSTCLTTHRLSCHYPYCLSEHSAWMNIPPITLSTSISDWYPTCLTTLHVLISAC